MKSDGAGMGWLVGIIISVIVFILGIIFVFDVLNATSSGAPLNCSAAFALDGLIQFSVQPAVQLANDAATISEYILVASILVVVGASAASATDLEFKYTGQPYKATNSDTLNKILGLIKGTGSIDVSADFDASDFVGNLLTGLGEASGIIVTAGALYFGSNSLAQILNGFASSIQKPILYSLCPAEIIPVNTSEGCDYSTCQFLNLSYQDAYIAHQNSITATLYIDKYIFYTYAETVHASVKTATSWITYQLVMAYYGNSDISYKDIICTLYAMQFDGNNIYKLLYGNNSEQKSMDSIIQYLQQSMQGSNNIEIISPLPDEVCNYLGINPGNLITNGNSGVSLIEAFFYNITAQQPYGIPGMIIEGPGIYLINIIYDGINHIIIESIYLSGLNNT